MHRRDRTVARTDRNGGRVVKIPWTYRWERVGEISWNLWTLRQLAVIEPLTFWMKRGRLELGDDWEEMGYGKIKCERSRAPRCADRLVKM